MGKEVQYKARYQGILESMHNIMRSSRKHSAVQLITGYCSSPLGHVQSLDKLVFPRTNQLPGDEYQSTRRKTRATRITTKHKPVQRLLCLEHLTSRLCQSHSPNLSACDTRATQKGQWTEALSNKKPQDIPPNRHNYGENVSECDSQTSQTDPLVVVVGVESSPDGRNINYKTCKPSKNMK